MYVFCSMRLCLCVRMYCVYVAVQCCFDVFEGVHRCVDVVVVLFVGFCELNSPQNGT